MQFAGKVSFGGRVYFPIYYKAYPKPHASAIIFLWTWQSAPAYIVRPTYVV